MSKFARVGSICIMSLLVLSLTACGDKGLKRGAADLAETSSSDSSAVAVDSEDKYSDEQDVKFNREDEEVTIVDWRPDDDEGRSQSELDQVYLQRAKTCIPRVICKDDTQYYLALNKMANELADSIAVELSFKWDDESLYDRELNDDDMKFALNIDRTSWPEGEINPETGEPTKEFQAEYESITGTKWLDDMRKLYVGDEGEAE